MHLELVLPYLYINTLHLNCSAGLHCIVLLHSVSVWDSPPLWLAVSIFWESVCAELLLIVDCSPQVLCYVLLRNSASILQSSHSNLLQQFGSLPLWLLVSHHHILLAWNGQALLVFFPNKYYLNVLSVTVVYLFVFRVVGWSTKALKDSLSGKTPATTDS